MKKVIVILVTIVIIAAGLLVIKNMNKETKKESNIEVKTDAIKFKEEYESLNGQTNDNGKEYIHIDVDKENPMKYSNYEEVMNILENGTGVIYFGFPECPWCRNAVPVLIDAAQEMGIDTIYYFNALSIRDKKSLDESGNIVVEEDGTEEYKKLVETLYDVLTPYEGLNDESIKRLYFPTVVYVKDGQILSSTIGTVDSQDDPYVALTQDQYNELKQIYMDGINSAYDILCDEAC